MGNVKSDDMVINKIRVYFESNGVCKEEAVKDIANQINHPYTSLYLSLHKLDKEGFLNFKNGVVKYSPT